MSLSRVRILASRSGSWRIEFSLLRVTSPRRSGGTRCSAWLLRNDGDTGNHWVRFVLKGDRQRSNVSVIGSSLILKPNGVTQRPELAAARGYASQSELVATFGLGEQAQVDRVTIRWPGPYGGTQVLTDVSIDRVHDIRQAASH